MKREQGIDSVRVLLTFLVIIHHVSIVYGGSGDWYWKETNTTNNFLVAFNAINQSFFMGFFFLLSGYFSRFSIERKGILPFIHDRLIRLGIPLCVYFFFISPFTIALANPESGVSLISQTIHMMKPDKFEPGPLWFVFSLLAFNIALSFIYHYFPSVIQSIKKTPSTINLLTGLVFTGLFTFILRLQIPVGETLIWLQIGYFPMYILLFIVGVFAYPNHILASIEFKKITLWIGASLLSICTLPIIMIHPLGSGPFEGGANFNALFYALWEPFVACGIILGLLYYFNNKANTLNNILSTLTPIVYCMYIIHPPIIVYISAILNDWNQNLTLKLLINSFLSILACMSVSYCILKLPYVKRVL